MRVVMLSDYETRGGAAIAASRLAAGLAAHGVAVVRLVAHPDTLAHAWETMQVVPSLAARAVRRAAFALSSRRLGRPVRRRSDRRVLSRLLNSLEPDVINVHNLHGAGWDAELVDACCAVAPTVWTLHDMWSFTGRCAFSGACDRFRTGCDRSCPTPSEYPALPPREIAPAWRRRASLLRSPRRLVGVAPSRWLCDRATSGLWSGRPCRTIRLGLPLDVYRPMPREAARGALGLPTTGTVLIAGSQNLVEPRKGGPLLVEALRKLAGDHLCVLTFGEGELSGLPTSVDRHALGFLADDVSRSLAYNAADLLVHPALDDNLPLVVLEALACGTPVVALPVGGLPEVVRPGQTGWLAGHAAGEDLRVALECALRDLTAGRNLRSSCRWMAEEELSTAREVSAYLDLFSQLMAEPDTSTKAEERPPRPVVR
jgi:glycosyltransferase involved in cell wall biosynthesis